MKTLTVNLLQAGSLAEASGVLLRRLYQVPGGPWHSGSTAQMAATLPALALWGRE